MAMDWAGEIYKMLRSSGAGVGSIWETDSRNRVNEADRIARQNAPKLNMMLSDTKLALDSATPEQRQTIFQNFEKRKQDILAGKDGTYQTQGPQNLYQQNALRSQLDQGTADIYNFARAKDAQWAEQQRQAELNDQVAQIGATTGDNERLKSLQNGLASLADRDPLTRQRYAAAMVGKDYEIIAGRAITDEDGVLLNMDEKQIPAYAEQLYDGFQVRLTDAGIVKSDTNPGGIDLETSLGNAQDAKDALAASLAKTRAGEIQKKQRDVQDGLEHQWLSAYNLWINNRQQGSAQIQRIIDGAVKYADDNNRWINAETEISRFTPFGLRPEKTTGKKKGAGGGSGAGVSISVTPGDYRAAVQSYMETDGNGYSYNAMFDRLSLPLHDRISQTMDVLASKGLAPQATALYYADMERFKAGTENRSNAEAAWYAAFKNTNNKTFNTKEGVESFMNNYRAHLSGDILDKQIKAQANTLYKTDTPEEARKNTEQAFLQIVPGMLGNPDYETQLNTVSEEYRTELAQYEGIAPEEVSSEWERDAGGNYTGALVYSMPNGSQFRVGRNSAGTGAAWQTKLTGWNQSGWRKADIDLKPSMSTTEQIESGSREVLAPVSTAAGSVDRLTGYVQREMSTGKTRDEAIDSVLAQYRDRLQPPKRLKAGETTESWWRDLLQTRITALGGMDGR